MRASPARSTRARVESRIDRDIVLRTDTIKRKAYAVR